jgi:hypothetical protein
MRGTWALPLLAMSLVIGVTSKASLPKCHKQATCGDSCQSSDRGCWMYEQCKPIGDHDKAVEDKCGGGAPADSDCGQIWLGSGTPSCNTSTTEACGGNYYQSAACSG